MDLNERQTRYEQIDVYAASQTGIENRSLRGTGKTLPNKPPIQSSPMPGCPEQCLFMGGFTDRKRFSGEEINHTAAEQRI